MLSLISKLIGTLSPLLLYIIEKIVDKLRKRDKEQVDRNSAIEEAQKEARKLSVDTANQLAENENELKMTYDIDKAQLEEFRKRLQSCS